MSLESASRRVTLRGACQIVACASLALACFAAFVGGQSAPRAAQSGTTPAREENSAPRPPSQVVLNGKTVAKRVPAKAGEICLVCGRAISTDDVVYQVNGQRVPLHVDEVRSDLGAQLKQLVAQLEPRGAFLGAEQDQPPLEKVWFLIGLYVLIGLIFGALSAHRAFDSGHRPLVWFFAGLLLNLVGYLVLLSFGKRTVVAPAGVPGGLHKIPVTYTPQPCPGCGSLNHPSASRCMGCGRKLEPTVASEVTRAGLRPA